MANILISPFLQKRLSWRVFIHYSQRLKLSDFTRSPIFAVISLAAAELTTPSVSHEPIAIVFLAYLISCSNFSSLILYRHFWPFFGHQGDADRLKHSCYVYRSRSRCYMEKRYLNKLGKEAGLPLMNIRSGVAVLGNVSFLHKSSRVFRSA